LLLPLFFMPEMSHRRHQGRNPARDPAITAPTTRLAFGVFWALVCFGTILVRGPWAGFHGILLGLAGLLMVLAPPVVSLPRTWWILAAAFIVAGCASFLPAAWFGIPDWRDGLEKIGLDTGSHVVIQSRQAAETLAMFGIMLLVGLWLAGHRATAPQVRFWALAFTLGVAAYAVIAKLMQSPADHQDAGHFGFFPNRNHTATYLAMGAVCGLGNMLQAIRDKRFVWLALALVGTAICLWAVAGWSVSRAGVVLVAVACLAWLSILGRQYLGRHGIWAIALFALAAIGLFMIIDTNVKDRLSSTVEKAGEMIGPETDDLSGNSKPAVNSSGDLDFRIPTALDTLDLIRENPWTGIGAGQYYYVFPQYRNRTKTATDADSYHPESDWLWMAAETGVLSTLALAVLLMFALWKSLSEILRGRDRALRGACLVAAMIVPFHGLFDVPGHRITLAWSSAFLFALSLQAPSVETLRRSVPSWPFRGLAVLLLACAAFLIRAEWWNGPLPALLSSSSALEKARSLYAEDKKLQDQAKAENRIYQPDPAEDRLEKALTVMEQARSKAPLDRDLLRFEAFLAFHFDDKFDRIDRLFEVERALDPTWVAGVLRQAEAWSVFNPAKTEELWKESLRRAGEIDQLQPANHWSRAKTLQRIQQFAKGKPDLEPLSLKLE
jgi:O-antigen ligase